MVRVSPKFFSSPSLVKKRRGFTQPLVHSLECSKIALLFTFSPRGRGSQRGQYAALRVRESPFLISFLKWFLRGGDGETKMGRKQVNAFYFNIFNQAERNLIFISSGDGRKSGITAEWHAVFNPWGGLPINFICPFSPWIIDPQHWKAISRFGWWKFPNWCCWRKGNLIGFNSFW